MSSVGRAKNDKDSDSVLVQLLLNFADVETVSGLGRDWNQPVFDFEISCEFLDGDLYLLAIATMASLSSMSYLSVGSHNAVGFVVRLASLLLSLLPPSLHGKTAEHDGLGRTCCSSSHCLTT